MAALGPFERHPHLAAAVSGGRDSLALALLAASWAEERGGRLTALIVDHRLRPDSTEEAGQAARLLHQRGIAAEILSWNGPKPETGLSEAARTARYALLEQRCRALGILHLLLGHQADDQAETVLLRLADGSGPEGLAGIAPVVETSHLRLLRPLLGFGRPRLTATVLAHRLSWLDDPSNERAEFARVCVRRALDDEHRTALTAAGVAAASLRWAVERRLADWLAGFASFDPAGYAWLDLAAFRAVPPLLARRLLGRLAATLGGRHYPARQSGLERAVGALHAGRNAVAGGCLFAIRGSRVLACREAGAIAAAVPVRRGELILWDRRYRLVAPEDGVMGALGACGRSAALQAGIVALRPMPAVAAAALPALWREEALAAVFLPETGAGCDRGGDGRGAGAPARLTCWDNAAFRPTQGVAPPAWPLVLPPAKPMYLDRQTFSLRGRP
ncbi:MAG: tRNA lysidine(34) synthetase TilS [Reyranellaceae bacterium]